MIDFKYKSFLKTATMLLTLSFLLTQGGCGALKDTFNFNSDDDEGSVALDQDINLPAKKLLEQGMEDYSAGKYYAAAEAFDEILNRYPFSKEATLAELKAADSSYNLGKYAEALLLYEEFENRHPTNAGIPYVMFQEAMCNYKLIDRIDRDITGAEKAIALFRQLLKAYPDSPYTEESKARIESASEFLANHEFFVIKYYTRTGKYDQAKIRLKYLISAYPTSGVIPEAKELLDRIESGNPPRSRLTSWFPKVVLPDLNFFKSDDEEDSVVEPVER